MSDLPPGIVVLPAREQDLNLLDAFAERVWNRYHEGEGHDLDVDWSSRPVKLLAWREGAVVGLARGRISAGIGHLSELLVDPSYRGLGIGTKLLTDFEIRCRQAGCHKLSVHTEADGPARPWYEARGWSLEASFKRDKGRLDFVRLTKFIGD